MIRKLPLATFQRPDSNSASNRRRRCRYQFSTTLSYRAIRDGVVVLGGAGRTLNMSADGMLVEFEDGAAPGGIVEFALDWPGIYHGADRTHLILACRVLRCAGRTAAVAILHSEFRTARLHQAPRVGVRNVGALRHAEGVPLAG